MSIHKLTAGSGYDYLTRQVAAMDATEKGHQGLASYYTERGESPGVWVGSGMAGIDGLEVGNVVTADHMQALFASGHHPLANQRIKDLDLRIGRPDLPTPTEADYKAASRLGTPYKVYENDVSPFRIEVAERLAAINEAAGVPRDWPVPAVERAKVRTEVAREFFRAEHGREPADARELAATIAKHSRPKTNAVAGYDLTFKPVKSVSTLWAVADPSTAASIERAHQAAMKDALRFIEHRALFTRTGTNGVRQVDVRGLVATAFTHRDSRAGEPLLHTHVAVANKVQTLDGKWLAIDGRVLFKATVAASEVYNTALEQHLADALGVRFEERPDADARKRPVREIVGVDPALNARWSSRRQSIEVRRDELSARFQRDHGRPPTPIETIKLSQQATLETRDAKHEPRTLAEQRAAWNTSAIEVLGSPRRLKQMIHGTLNPAGAARPLADSKWFARATGRIIDAMEGRRATWQVWHVYAEAQRQIRGAGVPTDQASTVVDMLVSDVLEGQSVNLARPSDGVAEPVELRRADGTSVYTVAGSNLFTSRRVLDAEERLVTAAGRRDGYTVDGTCVDLALLESATDGRHQLNAGQVALVREMATSGARVQLAIAPAGSGKTTAMRAFAKAWSEGGGTVLGLAPSAAAADALRSQIDRQTDTLAKLTHSLRTDDIPGWVRGIGPSTVVVIDEAGMADTLSLDTAVQYILQRGGSVRLIGDDQQLAAIGAGGVLRDIRAQRGALHLSELVRFKDPAEGAASLALREGKPEALGFYLDRSRVHLGDLAAMTDDVFSGWQTDRADGLDSIMLAPTRDLVSDLNQRARAHRLEGADPATIGQARQLADGNAASVGDLIITRKNDRKLRTSATDWVKNGDRWTILEINSNGELTVQHTQHGRTVRLPRDYVEASTELGYACTVHTAQGVTSDSMHGLATGSESRQQLYTMLTRGAIANHLYLQVVGDGDPHSVIEPNMVRPLTATDILESILARDDAQQSATTLLREQSDPAVLLGDATQRYLDGLAVAAEWIAGPDLITGLDQTIEDLLPGLSEEAAWPPLRAHLLLLAAHGEDPAAALRAAAADRELATADDRAAVLDWRLDSTGRRSLGAGPLPWVPGIPARLADDPHWGSYLNQRSQLVVRLADQVRERATEAASPMANLPVWAQNGLRPDPATLADVEVWRGAMQVATDDRRPTGPAQMQKAAGTWQRRLNRRIAGDHTPALKEWSHLLRELAPQISSDEFTPLLAQRLAAMSRAGLQVRELVANAVTVGPLPDDHAAAALWWRMARHLTPAVAAQIGDQDNLTTGWSTRLADLLGADRAERIQASSLWPALVSNVDHGLQRGWRLEDLLAPGPAGPADKDDGVDECQALVWRTSIALEPIPDDDHLDYHDDEPPPDMWVDPEPPTDAITVPPHVPTEHADYHQEEPPEDLTVQPEEGTSVDLEYVGSTGHLAIDEDADVDHDLLLASMFRGAGRPTPEPTDADVRRMHERAEEWHHSPVARERMVEINNLTQQYFETQFTNSWGRTYLADRFGIDLAGHEHFRPGHAPAGWTNLVQHLRRHGVTDAEMLATGIASEARTGRLIDRFRDRVTFPIVHHGDICGFVGRRHPELADADKNSGPKYLNTPDTALFHKGAQLFGVINELLDDGAVPVIVEGPMDAIAVTLVSAGRHLGVAPLGTSLTDEQAAQLGTIGRDPIVATDADLAGQVAAERAFWMLTPHGLDPGYTHFPTGLDPADLLTQRGPAALAGALTTNRPLGDQLLTERLNNLPPNQAAIPALKVLAARPSWAWDTGISQLRTRLQLSQSLARRGLRDLIKAWHTDPRKAARIELNDTSNVRARLEEAAAKTPAERWAPLAAELDARLLDQDDWAATAALLQVAHDQGYDVTAIARALVDEALGERPARDLRYRLVSQLNLTPVTGEGARTPTPGRAGAARDDRQGGRLAGRYGVPRR
jgi:DNA primase catalytic core